MQLEELDLSMYGIARDDELRGVSTILSRGRLCFSVVHDVANECLVVNILRAWTSSWRMLSRNTVHLWTWVSRAVVVRSMVCSIHLVYYMHGTMGKVPRFTHWALIYAYRR